MGGNRRGGGFQPSFELSFGLKIVERDPTTSHVLSLRCQFCVHHGKEEKLGQKRSRTENTKYFKPPFRPENFRSHLTSQHAQVWQEYCGLSEAKKNEFFENKVPLVNTMPGQFGNVLSIVFPIKKQIVEEVLSLFFDDNGEDEEGEEKAKALGFFRAVEQDENHYRIEIKATKLFRLAVKFIARGSSFAMTADLLNDVREETGMACYTGCTTLRCIKFARVVLSSNLQRIHEILQQTWTFSFAIDTGNKQSTNYLDIRIRFFWRNEIRNVHLLAVPIYGRKSAENLWNLCEVILNCIAPNWKDTLLGFSSDGEPTMTGKISGVGKRLQNAANREILRVWCGLHQVDLVMQAEYQKLCNDTFVRTLTDLIGFLRRQQNFIKELESTCPKFVDTRWGSMKRVTTWLERHRIQVLQLLESKKPASTPSKQWWVVLLGLDNVAGEVLATVTKLQGKAVTAQEQTFNIEKLLENIKGLYQVEDGTETDSVEVQTVTVPLKGVEDFIQNQGMVVINLWEDLTEEEKRATKETLANLFGGLVHGLEAVLINPEAADVTLRQSDLPPVLPRDLVKLKGSELAKLVRGHVSKLKASGWTDIEVEEIERDYRKMVALYKEDEHVKAVVDGSVESFKWSEAWKPFTEKVDVKNIEEFCGGLSTIFPSTATVEADFSRIREEKNDFRGNLTHLSLEALLHCVDSLKKYTVTEISSVCDSIVNTIYLKKAILNIVKGVKKEHFFNFRHVPKIRQPVVPKISYFGYFRHVPKITRPGNTPL